VSLNNLQDIDSIMTEIIGEKFLLKLKPTILEWSLENQGSQSNEDIPSIIFRDLVKIFELRHIYCHEVSSEEVDTRTIYRCFDSCKIFLDATDSLISKLIDPNAPTCQAEMNERAYKDFEQVNEELRDICNKILDNLEEGEKLEFQQMQSAWETYRELRARMS